jgi:regulator of replication initiation timing
MENNITSEQQMIKDLEAKVFNLELENSGLKLANAKLGYSTRIMSEFHLTQDDKLNIANSIDTATNINDVKQVYDEYHKLLNNKALGDSSDFQMSPDFKDNVRAYLAVAIGYDPIAKMGENLSIVSQYFSFENKIRNTPKVEIREPMVDKLMKDRPLAIEAIDNMADVVNSFNTKES